MEGKATDLISGDFDVVCRYAGGKCGHTVLLRYSLHFTRFHLALCMRIPIQLLVRLCIVNPDSSSGEIDSWRARVFPAIFFF